MRTFLRNIPNLLSGYRLLAFPVLLWTIFTGNSELFILLLSVSLITDILDGLIARLFKLQTEFGAKLDSAADMGTYIAAFTGMIVLKPEFVASKSWEFITLLVMWVLPYLICLLRFRRTPHFHFYSMKIAGYLQGIFVFTFFNWGNADWYFWIMWSVSMFAFTEELIAVTFVPELRSNAKGLYFMVKEKGRIA